MFTRGIRGATIAPANKKEDILAATQELLHAILEANPDLTPKDIGSAFFTVTPDLDTAYPALAARQLGWTEVPLLCASEIPVPNGISHCIRVLIHWNTDHSQNKIRHIYLKEAAHLRPELSQTETF